MKALHGVVLTGGRGTIGVRQAAYLYQNNLRNTAALEDPIIEADDQAAISNVHNRELPIPR